MADHTHPLRDPSHKRSSRSLSPTGHDNSHSHYRSHSHFQSRSYRTRSPHNKRKRSAGEIAAELPHNARHLRKGDYDAFKPLFELYMDVEKGKLVGYMDEREVKGRWKSFLGKWNRGELVEKWYDPKLMKQAVQAHNIEDTEEGMAGTRMQSKGTEPGPKVVTEDPGQASDSDEEIGPTLPEMESEDVMNRMEDVRYARKLDRKEQKDALDELIPRAEAGTRERQLEKKKEVNEKMKSFREKSPGAAEVPDTELMGGGDGIESYKKQKQDFERKKNERELRKEEILRARMAEREERLQEYRTKEEGTMAMLKALAKQRFG